MGGHRSAVVEMHVFELRAVHLLVRRRQQSFQVDLLCGRRSLLTAFARLKPVRAPWRLLVQPQVVERFGANGCTPNLDFEEREPVAGGGPKKTEGPAPRAERTPGVLPHQGRRTKEEGGRKGPKEGGGAFGKGGATPAPA